jgi:hypothetical protein
LLQNISFYLDTKIITNKWDKDKNIFIYLVTEDFIFNKKDYLLKDVQKYIIPNTKKYMENRLLIDVMKITYLIADDITWDRTREKAGGAIIVGDDDALLFYTQFDKPGTDISINFYQNDIRNKKNLLDYLEQLEVDQFMRGEN